MLDRNGTRRFAGLENDPLTLAAELFSLRNLIN
jgi:hypothetical protein